METGLILPQHVHEDVRVIVYATLTLRPAGPVHVRRTVQYFDEHNGPGVRVYRDEHVTALDDSLYDWLNETTAAAYKIGKQLEERYHPTLDLG